MKAAAPSMNASGDRNRSASRPGERFAGLGWQAIAIVVCIAVVNALRRTIFNIVIEPDFGPRHFAEPLTAGLLVGFAMLLAVVATLNRYPQRGRKQYVAVTVVILLSSAIAVLAKDLWEIADIFDSPPPLAQLFRSDWLRSTVLGGLAAGAYLYFRAEAENAAMADRYALESEQMTREVAEARLTALEAQIEPHFLFNTLATVKRLYATDAPAAGRLLDNLMHYLSVALPRMRAAESTLGPEAALATAYLDIQSIRMGRRLASTISIPTSLHEARLPPFMLLTLIENAIKHGLNPLPEGGALSVTARSIDAKLIVEVRDTGQGFAQSSGVGTGLANIRARLALLYGPDASLTFSRNEPQGVAATLIVPLERSAKSLHE
jgi:sensor histidine kinase YesM